MKIEVTIEKKHVFMILGAMLLFTGIFMVYAYGGTNPSVMGHTPGEMAPGAFGGTSANDASDWSFRGSLRLNSSDDPILILKNTDSANKYSYIDWRDSTDKRLFSAGIWNSFDDVGDLKISSLKNGNAGEGLVVDYDTGNVRIEKDISVDGALCINGVCKTEWPKQKRRPNGNVFSVQLLKGQDGPIEPDADYVQVGLVSDFCALQNVQIGGGASYLQAGCQLFDDQITGFRILRAFRFDHQQEVYCSAICLEGPFSNA